MKKKKEKPVKWSDLDKLCGAIWGQIIRSVGKCERCGRKDNLQAAHIYPRGKFKHHPIKWDLDNGLCLCYGCHIHFAHAHPVGFTRWLESYRPMGMVYLARLAAQIKKADLPAIAVGLLIEAKKRKLRLSLQQKQWKLSGRLTSSAGKP